MTLDRIFEFAGNHPVLIAALFAVLTFIIFSEIRRKSGSKALSPSQVIGLMNNQEAAVIDVRETGEFKDGHIVGARNIPSAKLVQEAEKISGDKNKPIVLYCKSGTVSSTVCPQLTAAGYTQVYYLKSGLFSWQDENLPLTK